ncbi:MAG: FMN-dependent NADH-azoreductase [Turicibacter sp.]
MARVLYIKANPKLTEQSLTFQLSDYFIEEYAKNHPNDQIEMLDLYNTILPIMDYERLSQYDKGIENEIKENALHFKSFDKCIIAAPVWNHGFPAMLKIYLDNIVYRHVTFTYAEGGMVGLCTHMKVLNISTSGGVYEGDRKILNHHSAQVDAIFSLVGISDVTHVKLSGRGKLSEEMLLNRVKCMKAELKDIAKTF